MITRREFIKKAGTISAGLALSTYQALPALAEEKQRPNILFIIADDWSYPHAGVYGDKVVKVPNFEKVASEGILFTGSYCAAPTCTASRAGVLTGQVVHRLDQGANLYGTLLSRFQVYPDILEAAGYFVGQTGKAWAPGYIEGSGRTRNPAGPAFKDFKTFLDQAPKGKPFCFWFGSSNPHRPYELGAGTESGMKIEDVQVPPFLPDTPEVRSDILDYYYEVQLFDQQVGELLAALDETGQAENTIVVVTSDNGMPFPRSKANIYDIGVHMPLAIRWPARVKGGRKVDGFVSHTDFAPTFLDAAGLKPPSDMTGKSLMGVLTKGKSLGRDCMFMERERHANARARNLSNLSYPMRGVRTKDFHYIWNPMPDRWPAGDPTTDTIWGRGFGDIDGGPSKEVVVLRRDRPRIAKYFHLACDKRPEEELYDLKKDPWQLENVADKPEYAKAKKDMRARLDKWMNETGDPRAVNPKDDRWDKYEYGKKPAQTTVPSPT